MSGTTLKKSNFFTVKISLIYLSFAIALCIMILQTTVCIHREQRYVFVKFKHMRDIGTDHTNVLHIYSNLCVNATYNE